MAENENPFLKRCEMSLVCIGKSGSVREVSAAEIERDVELARRVLQQSTVTAHVLVGANTYEMAVYILATWRMGRTACPISPQEGEARIYEKIKKLGASLSIWHDPQVKFNGTLFSAKAMNFAPVIQQKHENTEAQKHAMNWIFTSGTTGYAKVVEQTRGQVILNATDLVEHLAINDHSVLATALPLFHVNALNFSLVVSWLTAGKLILFESFQPRLFVETICKYKVQIANVVPHMLKAIYSGVDLTELKSSAYFRFFVSAAAPIDRGLALEILNQWPLRVLQGYGLSEAVNFSCMMPYDLNFIESQHWMNGPMRPTIGVELPNCRVEIKDEFGEVCKEGVVGRIFVSGPTVMRRYLNEPFKHSDKIFEFETGDLGTYRTDMKRRRFFSVEGRIKEVIKRLGHSVSLVELDDLLSTWPKVGVEVISIGFNHETSGEEIGLVVHPKTEFSETELIHFCETKIPEFMRPRVILITKQNLFSASGKALRSHFSNHFTQFKSQIFSRTIQVFRDF